MSKSTLYKHLLQYKKNVYPFHMPGHKLSSQYNVNNMTSIDVTEVEGTDNLHHPKGILKDAQNKAAKTFGADRTFFLVNGSTGGILSAISAICNEKDQVLISRNCHKSVYNAIILNDLEPVYIFPDIIESNGIVGGVNPNHIEEKLMHHPEIKLVVVTSPTYEGFVSNITEIADIVHKYGKLLMIDEAHGAHFKFHKAFPSTGLEQGADIVIQSTHKTLTSITQTAMLHVNNKNVNCNELQTQLSLFQSSSPSYILMNSLDNCRELLDNKAAKLFNRYVKHLKQCRNGLKRGLKHLQLIDNEVLGKNHIFDIDYSKIVIDCSTANITGIELDRVLRNSYGIQVELSNINHIVAMTSIGDRKWGFKKLLQSLTAIDRNLKKESKNHDKYDIINHTRKYYDPKQALRKAKRSVPIKESIGKVAGEFVIPFPPGIPIIVPGELITEDNVYFICKYRELNIEIMGLEDTDCNTIRIIGEV